MSTTDTTLTTRALGDPPPPPTPRTSEKLLGKRLEQIGPKLRKLHGYAATRQQVLTETLARHNTAASTPHHENPQRENG